MEEVEVWKEQITTGGWVITSLMANVLFCVPCCVGSSIIVLLASRVLVSFVKFWTSVWWKCDNRMAFSWFLNHWKPILTKMVSWNSFHRTTNVTVLVTTTGRNSQKFIFGEAIVEFYFLQNLLVKIVWRPLYVCSTNKECRVWMVSKINFCFIPDDSAAVKMHFGDFTSRGWGVFSTDSIQSMAVRIKTLRFQL